MFIKCTITFLLILYPLLGEAKQIIRIGHFPTITHVHGLIGQGLSRQHRGWFEEKIGEDIELQWFIYNDGPSAMEAVFAGSLDLVYVGPSPTINAYVRSEDKMLKIIAGACNGGAALIVQPSIQTVSDFKGKKIATPQFGNTQDVAARAWFKNQGFHVKLTGGDLNIIPMSGASQFVLFKKEEIDGVWTVEPWVSRLVLEADGHVFLEESQIWPETHGKYVTTHLVASQAFLKKYPDLTQKWVKAHVELTEWINTHPDQAKTIANDELKAEIMKGLSSEVLDRAWSKIEVTNDPIPESLFKMAQAAYQVGFLKQEPHLDGIYELSFLRRALGVKKQDQAPIGH